MARKSRVNNTVIRYRRGGANDMRADILAAR
jgi:hypothetical protein